jgi:pSer/pThr/pTyr-binding forkhead associated (FHA) protein
VNSGPGAGAAAWGAPAASGPQGGFGAGDLDKTRIANPAAARTANMIVVKQGKEPGRMFEMRKDRMTIGRSRESDIFLEDLAVSRLHTTISHGGQGQYIIRDENSANGTYVNGQKVSEYTLNEGDEIQVGQTVLSFVRR